MKAFKRTLTLLLCLAMIAVYMPITAIADSEEPGEQVVAAEEESAAAEPAEEPAAAEPAAEETAPAEEAAPAEEVAAEEDKADKPAEEAKEKEPEKSEKEEKPEYDTVYVQDLAEVSVKAETAKDAFDEEVNLVVKPLDMDTDRGEVKRAEKALAKSGEKYAGALFYDIHFENKSGTEVEPKGTVSVKMTAKRAGLTELDPGALNAESFKVIHIGEKVEVVAAADENSAVKGTVDVTATEKAVKAIDASFEVDSFSPYVITWGDPAQSATIHWGTYEDGEFKDFETANTVDTTASSVDLATNHDGYYFVGVDYAASEGAEPIYVENESTLQKADGEWKLGNITIADGSHIYVNYADKGSGGYTPPPKPTPEVLSPDTNKTVTKNPDGTYTIQLDIEGKQDEVVTQVGANVIVIMDITQSMTNSMPGGGTRMAAAKSALNTLIDILDPDTNVINFTAVNFGNSANYSNGVNWTTATSVMESYVSGLPNNPSDLGTCWQAGLQGGIDRVGTAPAGNETYVIFVTDGNPNGWVQNGRYQQQGSGQFIQAAYNAAVPNANQLGSSAHFYGVFCGDADGYTHLADLVNGAGGDGVVNGSSTSALEEAFADIAQTIVDNLGAGNVSVDDGVPSLSSISANVTGGEAGGFEYYITPKGGSQQEWDEAPGASYDESNGVTWDLSKESPLKDGYVYTVKFTVWPSQEAYDYIADLNNGLVDPVPSEEELEAQGIEYKNGKYTLKTNTHLYTTFSDLEGNEYREEYDAKSEAMDLPTERIKIKKIWNNALDKRKVTEGVYLGLEKDSEDYITTSDKKIEVAPDDWESDYVYISMGFIKVKSDGSYEVLEPGHEYSVVEPEDLTYHWELTSEVYRPMMIKGEPVVLIKTDSPEGKDGEDYFTIDGNTYQKGDTDEFVLKAINDRRSYLQIEKKVTGSGADKDDLFELTVNITDPDGEDIWFSAYDENDEIVKEIKTSATAEEGDTGYYYSGSGSDFTVKIKAGWTLRFLNLKTGTEYSVEEKEADLPDGYKLDKAEASVTDNSEETASQEEPEAGEVDGSKVTGTVNVPNCEFLVDFTNEYAETEIEITKKWVPADGVELPSTDEFKDYLTLNVSPESEEDYSGNVTVTKEDSKTYKIKYTKLPKYIKGEEAEYKVEESEIEGYTTEGSPAEDGDTITNTADTGDLIIKKTIEGLQDEDNPPKDLKFKITGPNGFEKTVKYSDFTDGSYTIEDVAVGDYTVEESGAEVTGYDLTASPEGSADVTVEKGGEATAEFTNTYTQRMTEATVKKVWDDEEDKAGERPESLTVTLSDGTEVTLNADNDWTETVTDLPEYKGGKKVEYTWEEGDMPDGYELTDTSVDGTVTTLTNTYTPLAPVTIDPPVKKVVKGSPDETETYTFQLEAMDSAYPMPDEAEGESVMTIDIEGEGEEEFGVITFTEPGTYEYMITEVEGDNPDCEYDSSVYIVTAEVTEGPGRKLQVKRTYTKDGEEVDVAIFTFVNTYEDEGEPSKKPDTGDTNNPFAALMVFVIAAAGFGGLYVYKKRRDEE